MIWIGDLLRNARAQACKVRDRVRAFGQSVSRWFVRPYPTLYVTGNLPKSLRAKTLYVVEEDGFEEQAAMICPCGCGRVLHMNLLTDERPCWTLTRHNDGTSTLHPSVWRQKDCRSHFWFRKGRVIWCADALNPGNPLRA